MKDFKFGKQREAEPVEESFFKAVFTAAIVSMVAFGGLYLFVMIGEAIKNG
jgi:hypothetical protein